MHSSDAGILDSISESLESSDSEIIKSTCDFLQSVVVHDFPVYVFLSRKRIFQRLSFLCVNGELDVSEIIARTISSVCQCLLLSYKQQDSFLWKPAHEPVGALVVARDPGDGQPDEEIDHFTVGDFLDLILQMCKKLLQSKNPLPVHYILELAEMVATLAARDISNLSRVSSSFGQLLTLSRVNEECRNLHICLNLMSGNLCPLDPIPSSDFLGEVYNTLLDIPLLHFNPNLFPVMKECLRNHSDSLNDLHDGALHIFRAFETAGKLQLNQNTKLDDAILLLELDDNYVNYFTPLIMRNIHKNPELLPVLLQHPKDSVKLQTFAAVCDLITPVRNPSKELLNALIDESVLSIIVHDGLCSSNEEIFEQAERLFTLILKSRSWVGESQWTRFVEDFFPRLLPAIQNNWEKYTVLSGNIWDLVNQSILPADPSVKIKVLEHSVIVKFLIRGLMSKPKATDKWCESLVTMLCCQNQSHQMIPRLSALQPETLLDVIVNEQPITINFSIAAKFEPQTLLDNLQQLSGENTDLREARSPLVQLAIVLEDVSLHPLFLEHQGLEILNGYLQKALDVNTTENGLLLIPSIMSSLLCMIAANEDVDLPTDAVLNIVRCTILMEKDALCRRQCIYIMRTLSSRAKLLKLDASKPLDVPGHILELWKKPQVQISSKFLYLISLGTSPDEIANRQKALPSFLQLDQTTITNLPISDGFRTLKNVLQRIGKAESHEDLLRDLNLARELLWRFQDSLEYVKKILNFQWRDSFEKFFRVLPSSSSDEEIFAEILQVLTFCCSLADKFRYYSNPLIEWLFYITTNERHVFWLLFRQVSQSPEGGDFLFPALIRLVETVLRSFVNRGEATNHCLAHIIKPLRLAFEQDDQSKVYKLKTLKLVLDCLVATAGAILLSRKLFPEFQVLFQQISMVIRSFSSEEETNKGRSILQRCSVIMSLLLASPSAAELPFSSNLDWLVTLFRHSDPLIRTCCLQISGHLKRIPRFSEIMDNFQESIESMLLNYNQSCCVTIQAAVTLTEFDVSHQVVHYVCEVINSPSCLENPELFQVFLVLLDSLACKETRSSYLPIIASEALPKILSLTSNTNPQTWILLSVINKLVSRSPNIRENLSKNADFASVLVRGLSSRDEKLAGESSLLLTVFLVHLDNESNFHRLMTTILKADLDGLIKFLTSRPPGTKCSRNILLFLKIFLSAALSSEYKTVNFNLESTTGFCQWILEHWKSIPERNFKEGMIEILGLVLAAGETDRKTLEKVCDFVLEQLETSITFKLCSVNSLLCLVHSTELCNPLSKEYFTQKGIFAVLLTLWKTYYVHDIYVLEKILRVLEILADGAVSKEWRILLGMVLEHVEQKEAILIRNGSLLEEDEFLLRAAYEVFCVACSSTDSRRLLAKSRCWMEIADQWHPLSIKRMIPASQQRVVLTVIELKTKLLAQLTRFAEPILPGLDPRAVETLQALGEYSWRTEFHILTILRNLAFHSSYRILVLNKNVVGFFSRILYSYRDNEDLALMAAAALLALAVNNQRGKALIRPYLQKFFLTEFAFVEGNRSAETCVKLKKSLGV